MRCILMTDDCILDSPRSLRSVLLHSDNILCLGLGNLGQVSRQQSVCTEYVDLYLCTVDTAILLIQRF